MKDGRLGISLRPPHTSDNPARRDEICQHAGPVSIWIQHKELIRRNWTASQRKDSRVSFDRQNRQRLQFRRYPRVLFRWTPLHVDGEMFPKASERESSIRSRGRVACCPSRSSRLLSIPQHLPDSAAISTVLGCDIQTEATRAS